MRRIGMVIAMLAACAGGASGQTAPVRLTVDDAIARGVEASHRLAEISAREDAARAVAAGREASAMPQVALVGGYTRTNHVDEFGVPDPSGRVRVIYPDVPDSVRSRIDLQWPIYAANRSALVRAASAEADAIAFDRAAASTDLRLEITRAYWAVVTARASVEVVQASLDRIGAHVADVRNQLNVGLVPPNDVLTVEAQQSRQLLSLIEAKNIRETSSAELRRLLGLQAGTPIELVDRLERPVASLGDITAGVEAARANRAERKALQTRVEGADARGIAAAAARLPLLAIAGGYDVARPNLRIFPLRAEWLPSWDVSVNLRWSLWDGGRVRAEIAEADAGRRAAEQRLADFDSMVEVEVRQRVLDLEAAEASIAAAESGVRSAGEARRVLADRFAAGVATSTDVLDAQVALLQAELDRTRALANARLAAARLDRALGR